MKRSQLLFCVVVFGILILGYHNEQLERADPAANFYFPIVERPPLEDLVMPGGTHALEGEVRDSNSVPAPGVQLFLERTEPLERGAETLHWAVTDAEGRFRIEGLEAVEYAIVLYRPGVPLDALRERVTPPVDGPLTVYLAPALPPLEALPSITRGTLAGRVGLPAGRSLLDHPLEGYGVVARPLADPTEMTGAVTRHATCDDQGGFLFEDLVEAAYRLELLPPWAEGGSWPVLGWVEVLHGGTSAGPVLVLPLRAGSAAGVVREPDQRPLPGALVRLWPVDAPEHVWPPQTSDARGRVRIPDLPEGRYVVRVRAGAASSEVVVDVREGITSGLSFAPLDPRAADPSRAGAPPAR